jgi:SAM-dependent methyltransferase
MRPSTQAVPTAKLLSSSIVVTCDRPFRRQHPARSSMLPAGKGELIGLLLEDSYNAEGVNAGPEQVAPAQTVGLDHVHEGDYRDVPMRAERSARRSDRHGYFGAPRQQRCPRGVRPGCKGSRLSAHQADQKSREMTQLPPQFRPSGEPMAAVPDRGLRINVGCGATPTDGWINFDNSVTVRLARWPLLMRSVLGTRILGEPSWKFSKVVAEKDIRFASATRRIPCADNSAEVIYSSHMIEHLDCGEAQDFLREAKRVLQPGGIIRLAAPDLGRLVENYLVSGDADGFVAGTNMSMARSASRVSRIKLALIGPRHHLWMYDGRSLSKLLHEAGFADVRVVSSGKTNISDPGCLDLEERAEESVYVEAVREPTSGF